MKTAESTWVAVLADAHLLCRRVAPTVRHPPRWVSLENHPIPHDLVNQALAPLHATHRYSYYWCILKNGCSNFKRHPWGIKNHLEVKKSITFPLPPPILYFLLQKCTPSMIKITISCRTTSAFLFFASLFYELQSHPPISISIICKSRTKKLKNNSISNLVENITEKHFNRLKESTMKTALPKSSQIPSLKHSKINVDRCEHPNTSIDIIDTSKFYSNNNILSNISDLNAFHHSDDTIITNITKKENSLNFAYYNKKFTFYCYQHTMVVRFSPRIL